MNDDGDDGDESKTITISRAFDEIIDDYNSDCEPELQEIVEFWNDMYRDETAEEKKQREVNAAKGISKLDYENRMQEMKQKEIQKKKKKRAEKQKEKREQEKKNRLPYDMDAARYLSMFYNKGIDEESDLDDDGLEDDDAYHTTKKVSFIWEFMYNDDQVFQMKLDPIYKLYLMTRSSPRRLNSFGWLGRMDKAMFPTAANMKEEPKVFRHVGLRKWGKPESRYTCELPTKVGGISTEDRKSSLVMLPSVIGPICYLLSVCNENLEYHLLELKLYMDSCLLYSPYSYFRDQSVNSFMKDIDKDAARTAALVLADANLRAVYAFTRNRSVFLDGAETPIINDNFATHGIQDENVFNVYGQPSLVEKTFGFPHEDMRLYRQYADSKRTKSKRGKKSNDNSNDNNKNSNTRRGHSSHHHSSHRHSSRHHSSSHHGTRSNSGRGDSSRTGRGTDRSGGGTGRSGGGSGRSRSGRGTGRSGAGKSKSKVRRNSKSRSRSNQNKAKDVI